MKLPCRRTAKVYVASRASIPERPAMWRRLRNNGFPIISSWIDEDGPGETVHMGELWARIHSEIRESSALILYIEPDDFPLKGALVEVGIALALHKPVSIVAPGVVIDSKSYRPIGSWMCHPLIRIFKTVEEALLQAISLFPEDEERSICPEVRG